MAIDRDDGTDAPSMSPLSGSGTLSSSAPRPSVSIGLPVYNGAEDIHEALAGILGQSYTDFTLLVSDNASTDNTWSILEDWASKDPRIRVFRQPRNIGLMGNFRFLLDQAETDFFMFQADDDRIARNYLEESLKVFEAEPRCDLVCPYGVRTSKTGAVLHEEPFPRLDPDSRMRRIRTLLSHPEGTWIYALFRTAALREIFAVGERFGYVWASDVIMLLPLILNDRMRGTDATTFYYRPNLESLQSLRPQGAAAMARFLWRYARFHVHIAARSDLTMLAKLRLLPWLLNHIVVSLFERPYRRLFKHPAKRLLRRIGLWPKRTSTNAR